MGTDWTRGRKPLLAAVLSFIVPGLGQLYNGQALKALLCAVAYYPPLIGSQRLGGMLWGAIREGADLAPGSAPFWVLHALRGLLIAIGLAVWVYAVVDAWRGSRTGGE